MSDPQDVLRTIEDAKRRGVVEVVPSQLRKVQRREVLAAVGKSLPVPEFALLRQRGFRLIVKGPK